MSGRRGERGWWSRGRLWWRFVCLGALLGLLVAPIHLLSWTLPTYNPVFVIYYAVYLVLELILMLVLGIVVAGSVIVAGLAVAEETTSRNRALVTGAVAFMASAALAFWLSALGHTANPWAVAGITGVFVGGAFALVSYRHLTQA